MDSKALYLVQTDTTVGFLSQDSAKLSKIKNRPKSKTFVSVFTNFKTFKEKKRRIANKHKPYIRAAKETTFVSKNRASRIVKSELHSQFLQSFGWFFSTSANQSGQVFNETFARNSTEIIVEDSYGFHESRPSTILKLSPTRKVKLR